MASQAKHHSAYQWKFNISLQMVENVGRRDGLQSQHLNIRSQMSTGQRLGARMRKPAGKRENVLLCSNGDAGWLLIYFQVLVFITFQALNGLEVEYLKDSYLSLFGPQDHRTRGFSVRGLPEANARKMHTFGRVFQLVVLQPWKLELPPTGRETRPPPPVLCLQKEAKDRTFNEGI